MVRLGGNETGPDIGVPRAHHLKDGDGDKVRKRKGYHNLPKILDILRAVDLSGEIKLVGYLHEVLLKKVDIEDADEERNDKYRIGIYPAELGYGNVVGDREELAGDHHRCKKEGEEKVLTLELKARKCERRKNGDNEGEDGGHDTYVNGIEEQLSEVRLSECVDIVLPNDIIREEGGYRETVLHGGFKR